MALALKRKRGLIILLYLSYENHPPSLWLLLESHARSFRIQARKHYAGRTAERQCLVISAAVHNLVTIRAQVDASLEFKISALRLVVLAMPEKRHPSVGGFYCIYNLAEQTDVGANATAKEGIRTN